LPGAAVLLRVAWTDRHDLQTKHKLVSLANCSVLTLSLRGAQVWSIELSSKNGSWSAVIDRFLIGSPSPEPHPK